MRFGMIVALMLGVLPAITVAAPQPEGWGVVVTDEVPAYNKAGKPMGKRSAGDRFIAYKAVTINKEPAYFVNFLSEPKGEAILLAEKCRYFPGMPASTEELEGVRALQGKLSDYYATMALREQLIERARKRHQKGSPAEKLAELKAQLAKVPARDRALAEGQKKAASNQERLRYQDQRKELRYRTMGLQQEIKRVEAEAEAWIAAHPFNDASVRKGAVWKRLTQKLLALEPELVLCGITPGDAEKE